VVVEVAVVVVVFLTESDTTPTKVVFQIVLFGGNISTSTVRKLA
jgi:hypothetical protein